VPDPYEYELRAGRQFDGGDGDARQHGLGFVGGGTDNRGLLRGGRHRAKHQGREDEQQSVTHIFSLVFRT